MTGHALMCSQWEKWRERKEGEKRKKHDRKFSFALEQVSSGAFEALYFMHSFTVRDFYRENLMTVFSASLQRGFDKVIFTLSPSTPSTLVRRPTESCVMSAIYTPS